MPTARLVRQYVFAAALAALLQACSSAAPPDAYLLPDSSGIYAVNNDELRKINGNSAFENSSWSWRSTLPGGTAFVVYREGQNLSQDPTDAIHIRRVAWVRSRITQQGDIMPNSGSRWDVPTLERYDVPATFRSIAGHADAILVTPQARLKPGLYQIEAGGLGGELNARIGVDWPNIDQDSYSAANCVDRHELAGGQFELQPCAGGTQQQQVEQSALPQPGPNFKVSLQKPVKEQVDGVDTLLIQGMLTSTATVAQDPPEMNAELLDGNGQVLAHWSFVPQVASIAPGQSVNFQTRVMTPPKDTATVHVNLAANAATANGSS